MENNSIPIVLYSIAITSISFVIMTHVLKQPFPIAMDRSILVGVIILLYTVLFGYNIPPGALNKNIFG
jgi:hypothetical protein